MISLDLPLPTSTNRLHKWAGKRVVSSPEYEAWIEEAGYRLNGQHPKPIKGPVELEYQVGKSRRDLGNIEKAATDLLVRHGIIEGDGPGIVRKISLALDASVEGVRVTITPLALDSFEPIGNAASRVVQRLAKTMKSRGARDDGTA